MNSQVEHFQNFSWSKLLLSGGDQIAILVEIFVEMVGEINRSIIQEDAKLYHFPHVMVLYSVLE